MSPPEQVSFLAMYAAQHGLVDDSQHDVLPGLKGILAMVPDTAKRPLQPPRADGATLLHLACSTGGPSVTRVLLEAGADVSATDAAGETSIRRAALFNQAECIRLLAAHGASLETPTAVEAGGYPPLMTALMAGNGDAAACLLELGASPLGRDASGALRCWRSQPRELRPRRSVANGRLSFSRARACSQLSTAPATAQRRSTSRR